MRAQVVERYTLFVGKLTYAIAQTVVQALHECTLLNIKNFIECSGNMETECIHVVVLGTRFHLFPCEPTLVAEGKLQLVAVLTCILGAKNRHYRWKFHLADTCQGIDNLLLLVLELVLIGQALPFATAAHAIVLAERHCALTRIFIKFHSLGLGVAVFLATNFQVHNIAGNNVGHKNHKVVHSRQGLALGSNGGYLYLLQKRKLFLFSCHVYSLLFLKTGERPMQQKSLRHLKSKITDILRKICNKLYTTF